MKNDTETKGIECPKCGCCHFFAVKVLRMKGHVRRRKECRNCGRRVTTTEKIIEQGSTGGHFVKNF